MSSVNKADKLAYLKPCSEGTLEEIVTALWQRTNCVERLLGIEYQYDCIHAPNPVPGLIKKMQWLCERWSVIALLLGE